MSQMYSIDPRHLNIKKADGGMTRYNPSNMKYRPSNEFDLANASVYSENGELIQEADSHDYDWQMAIKLQRITPLYKSEQLLNHHYEKTPDKQLFLTHIKYHILGFLGEPKPLRKEFILKWVESKEALLEERRRMAQEYEAELKKSLFTDEASLKFRQHYNDASAKVCNALIEKYNKDEAKFPSLEESHMVESKLESIRPTIEELQAKFRQIDIAAAKSFDNDTIVLFGYLKFRDKLRERLAELRRPGISDSNSLQMKRTHREWVLYNQFLADSGLGKKLSAKEMKAISSKRYEAFLSLTPQSRTRKHKPASRVEMENVVQMLANYPKAQSLAIKALKSIK